MSQRKMTWKDRIAEIIRDCTPAEAVERAEFATALARVRQDQPTKPARHRAAAAAATAAVRRREPQGATAVSGQLT